MTVQSIIIPALDVICLKPQGKVRMSYWGILSREAGNLKGIYGIVLIFGMAMLQNWKQNYRKIYQEDM
jgi:hypothetical protein